MCVRVCVCGASSTYTNVFQDGWSPLIASSRQGHTDVVELLIEKKVQLDIQTKVQLV